MTLTDYLLIGVLALLSAGLITAWRQHDELLATLNALAEMLGEEIDRRKRNG